MQIKEKFTKKLLVEGNEDMHVIKSLCQKFDIPENFEVIDCKGIDALIQQIPVRLKESGATAIGIIIDADIEIKNRWNSLSSILSNHGFTLPKELAKEGLITTSNGITVGVWLMPNNYLNGMLEDFMAFLIQPGDKLLEIASNILQEIENQNINRYPAIHKSKALIHTWLAWQEVPGTPMGLAITKKYLTTEEETCLKLINWLNNTFK